MLTVPYEKRQLSNFEVLERLAASWNPPDVSGKIQLVEGLKPNTLHVCFMGQSNGRDVVVFGSAIEEHLFIDTTQRKALARSLRDYFAMALSVRGDGAPATVVSRPE